jgi:hypothetical protein
VETLHLAGNLMGKSFRNALDIIEHHPKSLRVIDYDMFFLLAVNNEKQVVFKSNSKARLNDCSCKGSWERKVGEKAPYMCIHQIIIELVVCIFKERVPVEKGDCSGTGQLAELLELL